MAKLFFIIQFVCGFIFALANKVNLYFIVNYINDYYINFVFVYENSLEGLLVSSGLIIAITLRITILYVIVKPHYE